MINAKVEVYGNGDGFLVVDTADWFADRGEVDDSLTDMLRQWIQEEGIRHARAEDIARFFAEYEYRVTHGGAMLPDGYDGKPLTEGLYGEGAFWDLGWTGNQENYFTDDFGIVCLDTYSLGTLAVDYIGWHADLGTDPTVYRSNADDMTDWATWGQAYGQCKHGHNWSTDDNYRLYLDGGSGSQEAPTITDQARSAAFMTYGTGWIECPTDGCRAALRFMVL